MRDIFKVYDDYGLGDEVYSGTYNECSGWIGMQKEDDKYRYYMCYYSHSERWISTFKKEKDYKDENIISTTTRL